jgi:RNA polymerase sigma-70 factor, ECF subfamily
MNRPEAYPATSLDSGALSRATGQTTEVHQDSFELRAEISCLHDSLAPGLLRYATALSRHPEMAGDAVQESFLRYFVARQNGSKIENPRVWLFSAVQCTLTEMLSRLDNQPRIRVEDLGGGQPGAAPDEDLHLQELGGRLSSSLTGRELRCLMLRAEGLRYKEIAEALEIRMGTVAAFLNRAVRKAKAALGKEYGR